MIRREELVAAIQRIDASERELLWLSLFRRVPDSALGRLYGCEQPDVARRRADAIERVADELEVQRGEDFGSVLTGLMEGETWVAVAPDATLPVPAPEPPAEEPAEAEPERREPEAPVPPRGPRRRLRPLRWALAGALATGAAAAAIVLASDGSGGSNRHRPRLVPLGGSPVSGQSDSPGTPCYFTASVGRATPLYRRPGGPVRATVAARTGWGSPLVLHVVVRRAAWLGVIAPQLRNGELGWLPVQQARVGCTAWSLDADLSSKLLRVRRRAQVVRSVPVAVGAHGRRMPAGRFSITDLLEVNGRSAFGCCVLALSGHETGAGRRAGDRLAIYAGRGGRGRRSGLGTGALLVSATDARWLIDNVPLGTPIFIRR